MNMESVNEGCKLVAQAKELICRFLQLEPRDDYGDNYLKDANILLDMAISKLTSST